MKAELVWRTVFLTRAEAEASIGRYIDSFYKPRPPPLGVGLRQPGHVRETGRPVSRRLSTKARQVQYGVAPGLSEQTDYYMVEQGLLPVFRAGKSIYARKSVLLAWIARQEGGQPRGAA